MSELVTVLLDAGNFFIVIVAKSSLVLLCAFILSWILKNKSAALRSGIWNISILAILIIPVLSGLVPSWEVATSDNLTTESIIPVEIASLTSSEGIDLNAKTVTKNSD